MITNGGRELTDQQRLRLKASEEALALERSIQAAQGDPNRLLDLLGHVASPSPVENNILGHLEDILTREEQEARAIALRQVVNITRDALMQNDGESIEAVLQQVRDRVNEAPIRTSTVPLRTVAADSPAAQVFQGRVRLEQQILLKQIEENLAKQRAERAQNTAESPTPKEESEMLAAAVLMAVVGEAKAESAAQPASNIEAMKVEQAQAKPIEEQNAENPPTEEVHAELPDKENEAPKKAILLTLGFGTR